MTGARQTLTEAQAATRLSGLSRLANDLRHRFLQSADLLGLPVSGNPDFSRPRHDERVDLSPLFPFWSELCRRYHDEVFDAQMGLLDRTSEAEEWSQYLYWALIPSLVEDNPIARNVMQALGLHRGSKSDEAAKLLVILAKEFRMPPPPRKN